MSLEPILALIVVAVIANLVVMGLLVASPGYRARFLAALADRGLSAAPVALVTEPAEGAVRLAIDKIAVAT